MAGNVNLSAKNLEKLGIKRLANLLMEVSTGNSTITRRLKMELAGETNPEHMAKDLEKRLDTVARTIRKIKKHEELAFSVDLEAQRRAIVETLAEINATEAFRLLWKFVEISESVYARCLGSGNHVKKVFEEAEANLEPLARKSKADMTEFAQQLIQKFANTLENWPTHFIRIVASALGKEGLEYLNSKLVEFLDAELNDTIDDFLAANPWLSIKSTNLTTWGAYRFVKGNLGEAFHDNLILSVRLKSVLQIIAEIRDDVDNYVNYYDAQSRTTPNGINDLTKQLLKANKANEVLEMISSVDFSELVDDCELLLELKDREIAALELLDRKDEAQSKRMQCFREQLSVKQLRDYIDRLPDFEDVEAEAEAMKYVENHDNKAKALYFFAAWPSLERVAKIVKKYRKVLNTKDYESLVPIAEALTTDYPVAAVHVYRAVIFTIFNETGISMTNRGARLYKQCLKLLTGNKKLYDGYLEEELTDWLEERLDFSYGFWENI